MFQGTRLSNAITDYVINDSAERNLSPKTVKGRRECLGRLKNYLKNKGLTLLSAKDYIASLRAKGWSPLSIKGEITRLKAFSVFCFNNDYQKVNFLKDLVKPRVSGKLFDLVPFEIAEKIIIEGCRPGKGDNSINRARKRETEIALRFMLRTGLRISELIGLRGKDIDIENRRYSFKSKGGNIDILPIPQDMLNDLVLRSGANRVFEITAATANLSLKRGTARCGITNKKITCHSLRHIFCTSMQKEGTPIQVVSRLMRHSNVGITDKIYSHYNIEDLAYALNTGNSLIRKNLTSEQTFDLIEKLLAKTGLTKNSNLSYSINRDNNSFSLIIKEKT